MVHLAQNSTQFNSLSKTFCTSNQLLTQNPNRLLRSPTLKRGVSPRRVYFEINIDWKYFLS